MISFVKSVLMISVNNLIIFSISDYFGFFFAVVSGFTFLLSKAIIRPSIVYTV